MLEAYYLQIKISSNSLNFLAHLQLTACMQKHSQAAFIWLLVRPGIFVVCHAVFSHQIVQLRGDLALVEFFLKMCPYILASIYAIKWPGEILGAFRNCGQ